MRVESMAAATVDRGGRTLLRSRVALAALATLLLAPAAAHAADPGGSGSVGKSPAVRLESIPGSTAKRVILTAKAAERLGIATGKVGEDPIVRKEMVGGLIIPPLEKQPEPKQAQPSAAAACSEASRGCRRPHRRRSRWRHGRTRPPLARPGCS